MRNCIKGPKHCFKDCRTRIQIPCFPSRALSLRLIFPHDHHHYQGSQPMPYSVFFQHQVPLPLQAVCCQTRHISFLIFKQWVPRVTRQNCSGVTSFRFLVLSASLPQCRKPSLHQSCPCDGSEACSLVFFIITPVESSLTSSLRPHRPFFPLAVLRNFPNCTVCSCFFIGTETSVISALPSLSVAVPANWHSQTTSGPQMLFWV